MEGFVFERLVENKYKMYFPAFFHETVLVVEKKGSKVKKCLVREAYLCLNDSPACRLWVGRYNPQLDGDCIDFILIYERSRKRVWLIPIADVVEMSVIRLEGWSDMYELPKVEELRFNALKAASLISDVLSPKDLEQSRGKKNS